MILFKVEAELNDLFISRIISEAVEGGKSAHETATSDPKVLLLDFVIVDVGVDSHCRFARRRRHFSYIGLSKISRRFRVKREGRGGSVKRGRRSNSDELTFSPYEELMHA